MNLDQNKTWLRTFISHKYFPILVLLLVNIVIGSFVVVDYGQSQDEHLRLRYADQSLEAYFGANRRLGDEKGAFYVMVALVGSRLINIIHPDWLPIEAWHFMQFLAFLMGLFFLYRICLRFVGKWAALAAVLMFNTQPLLWGHAFINPKDIPFMAFFLASMDLGLEMAASLPVVASPGADAGAKPFGAAIRSSLLADWSSSSRRKKLLLGGLSLVSIALLVLLTAGGGQVQTLMADLVRRAYASDSSGVLGTLFTRLAGNAQETPVDLYVTKALSWYPLLVTLAVVAVLVVNYFILRGLLPGTTGWLWRQYLKPFVGQVLSYLRNKKILAASLFLGMSTAIRVAGPLSGFLVAAYLLLKKGRKVIPALVAYFSVALVVTYLFWPALWKAPFQRYTKSLSKAIDFPWEGKVMFAGVDYEVTDLPRSFLPTVLSLQFTETAMLMFLVGVVTAVVWSFRKRIDWRMVALIGVWLAVPVIAIVIVHPVIYDNFRHILFVIPPIFIFAAIGFQAVFDWFKRPLLSGAFVLLLLIPNLYWMVNLHPYQYVYYNSLAGNVRGAFRQYEMDYWGTAYREAIEFVNEVAPPSSRVIVLGTDQLVSNFARADLQIEEYRKLEETESVPQAYVILTSRHNKDLELYPDAPRLLSIERAGVILAVVKQIDPLGGSTPP